MGVMGRARVNWRVWAVMLCLQIGVVCGDLVEDIHQEMTRQERSIAEDDDDVNAEARGKKKKKLKLLLAFLVGVVVVKSILIPLALKAVSFVAGKAFLLSAMSLILSAILGFKQLATHGWDRMGQMMVMKDRGEVTETYHPMPTEAMYHKISSDQYWADK